MSLPDPAESEAGKPSRSYTKRMTVANNFAAWLAIAAAIWLGREMASIVVPLMVILIASLLGIYQGIGHFDLRTIAGQGSAKSKGNRIRVPPEAG